MMTCDHLQNWLLSAESPDAATHPDPAALVHVAQCSTCRTMMAKLQAAEAMVRRVPTPAAADQSKLSFLQRLPVTVPPRRSHVRTGFAWATAASVLIAVGITAFMLMPSSTVMAQSQVMDSLVEWNLKLSEVESPHERDRLHQGRRPQLHQTVRAAKLSPRERQLADQLLDHADWLARNGDSLDAAERFQDIAETVLDIMDESPDRSSQAEQYAVVYSRLMDRGVEANLEQAEKIPGPDAKRQMKLQRVAKGQQRHEAKLKAMAAKLTDTAREKAQPKRKAKLPK